MVTFASWDKSAHWVRVYRARIRLGLERCRICGVVNDWGTENQLTLDHIHPRSRGGPSLMENATILCLKCNNAKGDGPAEHRESLWMEELRASRRYRWSQQAIPEVPDGPWGLPQPPRSLKSRRRELEKALPEWARPYYAELVDGEIPPYVKAILRSHYRGKYREIPANVQRLLESG
jgi:hypothetical protein